jgi:hypothetical protein
MEKDYRGNFDDGYKCGYDKAVENAIKVLVYSETFHSTGSQAALAFRKAMHEFKNKE